MTEKVFDSTQQAVIDFNKGCALVLAAPGCGKTEVLSQRILKAHNVYNVPYSDMLCITFTNRASREMKERIQARVGDVLDDVFVGNLHRFCINFLYANEIVPVDTGILDDTDQAEFIAEMFNMDIDRLRSSDISGVLNFAAYITEAQLNLPVELQIHKSRVDLNNHYARERAMQYINYKKDNNVIDFDDLIILTYSALMSPTYRDDFTMANYRWVQVDEIQDLNPLQLAIVEKITAPDNYCAVYLGDQRQSIYSFLGARAESIRQLRDRCGNNFFIFSSNYRSPDYMLKMLNQYATSVLNVSPDLLPQPANTSNADDAMLCCYCNDASEQYYAICNMTQQLCSLCPDESIGILVSTNQEAEAISHILDSKSIPNLLIARKDMFKAISFKTLYSHLSVAVSETRFSEWPRLLYQTRCLDSLADSRRCVQKMRSLGISPADLMRYDASTYSIEFYKSFRDKEIVIFDTETTGLDIFNDDIIQIAALKVRNGVIVPGSELDIIIQTDKVIPSHLGRIENPMVAEYQRRQSTPSTIPYQHFMQPDEAFSFFVNYVGDDELLGHNTNFDVHILENNISRRSPSVHFTTPVFWDTLKLSRLLDPHLASHRLETLLRIYKLEGVNSHNALDDIRATSSLASYCFKQIYSRAKAQYEFITHPVMRKIRHRMMQNYYPLFQHTTSKLYASQCNDEHTLPFELKYAYDYLLADKCIEPIKRFDYIYSLFAKVLVTDKDKYFYQHLTNHINEIRTFNEADLYQNGIIREKVHIMTIHKAKGLEFNNVIVFNVSEGSFPTLYSKTTTNDIIESARRLYVALSRSSKRLFFTYGPQLSRFLIPVSAHFKNYSV
ncbi:MAG: UvrD-helicase domain-containing protein [Bacteroidales bacterium]|nr:UvrD-helicase domain-containing protein [Bacteroidales bacterium]